MILEAVWILEDFQSTMFSGAIKTMPITETAKFIEAIQALEPIQVIQSKYEIKLTQIIDSTQVLVIYTTKLMENIEVIKSRQIIGAIKII